MPGPTTERFGARFYTNELKRCKKDFKSVRNNNKERKKESRRPGLCVCATGKASYQLTDHLSIDLQLRTEKVDKSNSPFCLVEVSLDGVDVSTRT